MNPECWLALIDLQLFFEPICWKHEMWLDHVAGLGPGIAFVFISPGCRRFCSVGDLPASIFHGLLKNFPALARTVELSGWAPQFVPELGPGSPEI